MSAIGAIYPCDHHVILESDLMQLNQAMQHHGQDGSGIWFDQHCGLTQQQTKLTRESLYETLPYYQALHQITLVTHCRLFNRKELCEQLACFPLNDKTGDAQLIIFAYIQWGLAFIHYLVGEFSFILWDAKQEQLVCAVDHFNSRPLYYHVDEKYLVMASEISALHRLPYIPRRPNLNKIARNDLMRFQLEPGETCFEKIFFLPAAHFMVKNKSRLSLHKYWEPELGDCLSFDTDEAFSEAFQSMFKQAINASTRTHLPICLQLSGGLDSSAIAMMASQCLKPQHRELICLSNVLPESYQGPLHDEREFIHCVTAPNLIKHAVIDSWRGPFDHLDSFATHWQSSPQHYQYRALNAAARGHHAKLMLHGTLGEMTCSYAGYEYLAQLFSRGQISTLHQEIMAHKKNYKRSYAGILAHNVGVPLLPSPFRSRLQSHHRRHLMQSNLINPAFIQQHFHAEQLKAIGDQLFQAQILPSLDARHNSLMQWNWFLRHNSHLFSQMNDAPESAVYLSNPYFDKRLVEFCLNVPNHFRFRNGYPRSMIRLGMRDLLPDKIKWRTCKEPFLPDYSERYNQQLPLAKNAVRELARHPLVREVIQIQQLTTLLEQKSTSNGVDNHHDFMNYLVIPRTIYLAKFLSSF